MSSPGNPRMRVRLSLAMQAVVAQAQGDGSEAAAMRALLLLGAAHAGLDVAGVAREIAQAQGELLHPAVITALRAVQDASGGGSHLAATWQPPPVTLVPYRMGDLIRFRLESMSNSAESLERFRAGVVYSEEIGAMDRRQFLEHLLEDELRKQAGSRSYQPADE